MNDQTHTDAILIERSQLGDTYAFDELIDRYSSKAFMYALRMTKHADDAADVVSEGFIRVSRALNRFKANSSFSTWMFRILRNCFLDIRKKRTVKIACSLDASMESDDGVVFMQPIDTSETAFELSAKREASELIKSALERLPSHQHQLLLMYYEDELSYSEIAGRMIMPAGTIKSRLHRAKHNLKEIMEKDPHFRSVITLN